MQMPKCKSGKVIFYVKVALTQVCFTNLLNANYLPDWSIYGTLAGNWLKILFC